MTRSSHTPATEVLSLLNQRQSNACAGFPVWLLAALAAALCVACGGGKPEAAPPAASTTPQAGAAASPIPWGTIEPPAQVGLPAGTSKPQERSPVTTHTGVGVVRSVNLREGWFEIDHEDIPNYMPAMRMQWTVRDRSLLKSVSAGDRVNFTLEDDNGSEVITGLKKAPAAR